MEPSVNGYVLRTPSWVPTFGAKKRCRVKNAKTEIRPPEANAVSALCFPAARFLSTWKRSPSCSELGIQRCVTLALIDNVLEHLEHLHGELEARGEYLIFNGATGG